MRLRAVLIAQILLLSASSAVAGAKGEATPARGEALELAPMGLPLVDKGRVRNYVFIQARLVPAPGADLMKLREKEPYYRDAMVKAAHRGAFAKAGDWTALDKAQIEAVLLAEARRISGPKSFSRAVLVQQTPRRRMSAARTAGR